MARPHGLSKSRYTTGLQCHKQLWWRVHEHDAPELEVDEAQQALFDQGSRVGAVAREHVPGGVLIDLPYDRFDDKLAATRKTLDEGTRVVYEASFLADQVFVAVDILERTDDGFRIIEVKSSTKVKDEHIPDAAVQVHVLRRAGLDVRAVAIMVLNRACAFPDLSDLFVREDVTDRVEAMLPGVPALVKEQLRMLAGPLPKVPIGEHCHAPYECPFLDRCWPARPEHHVSTLYYMKREAAALEARGFSTIDQLPADLHMNPQADRQRRAVLAGRMLVEGDLAAAMKRFRAPLAYLDFETVAPAIPVWNGCHPYDAVAAQFSCHRETRGGKLAHHEWVADGPQDPRPEMARRVIKACRGARTVVAYNMSFERSCLRRLAVGAPELADELEDISARLEDPLPVVRDHIYHPDFGGSFGLKSVFPALVEGLGYEGLAIDDGNLASVVLGRLLLEADTIVPEERTRLREALRRYCEMDTLGMVRLMERMRELAKGPSSGN